MARNVFKGFLARFEVGDLLSVGHGFVCSFFVHVTYESGGTFTPPSVTVEVARAVPKGNASPVIDAVGGVVWTEVVWDTCLSKYDARGHATSTLSHSVSFEVCGVLHHAR
jgi:hypothetical protein